MIYLCLILTVLLAASIYYNVKQFYTIRRYQQFIAETRPKIVKAIICAAIGGVGVGCIIKHLNLKNDTSN